MSTFKRKYNKSERALRRLRGIIFDYPEHREAQASNVLHYLKARHLRDRKAEREMAATGPYSGLTRRELTATGTCETDWF